MIRLNHQQNILKGIAQAATTGPRECPILMPDYYFPQCPANTLSNVCQLKWEQPYTTRTMTSGPSWWCRLYECVGYQPETTILTRPTVHIREQSLAVGKILGPRLTKANLLRNAVIYQIRIWWRRYRR